MKTIRLVVFAVAAVLLVTPSLRAQTSQGRISGRVADQTGAVVAGATVTILNPETGIKRVLTTNATGEYFAPNLDPGVYTITVEAPSFKKLQRPAFRLEVATDVRQDFVLRPGAATETVTVSGEQPLVETLNDTLGGTITNKAINELPLQGRDFQNLLELRPGVQRVPGGGFHSTTSNGNRTDDNNYIVDGTDDNDSYYGETVLNNAGVQGTPASHLPLDAIQEFNDQENQGADYGWKPGAVVNIGLKSGTNQFHGTAYYFHRNSAFDARNYFDPAPDPVAALLLHQFGASVGGPILREKLFFFGTYEGVRHRVGNPFDVSSPVTESLVGKTLPPGTLPADLSIFDAEAQAGCPSSHKCNALSYLVGNLFPPNPGFTASTTDPTLIDLDLTNHNREDNALVKIDYHPNERNTISGRYVYGNSLQTEEDTYALGPQFLSQANTKLGVMGVNWTYTPNSRWVNEARFGFNRDWQKLYTKDHTVNPLTGYGINTGITDPTLFGLPRINVSPFNYLGGNSSWPLYTAPNTTYQFIDNLSYTRGRHNVRFGGEFRHGGSDYLRAQYGRGRVRFSILEDFIAGKVRKNSFGGGDLLVGNAHRNLSLTAVGGFVQDDWRIRPRLTLNLGVRYDLSFPVKEEHDLMANFLPNSGVVQVGHGIDNIYPLEKNAFSPRLGLAWDIFGTGKTVLRAGGAIIFEQPSIRDFINSGGVNLNPTSPTSGTTPGNGTINTFVLSLDSSQINWKASALAGASHSVPIFNTALAGNCNPDNPCSIAGIAPNLRTPYVASWNFNVQQQLTTTTVLQIGYVSNHGIKLYSNRDINQVNPAVDDGSEQFGRPFTYSCPAPIGGGVGGPCYPYIGFMQYMENASSSEYNGLQVTLTQKAWKGLNILAGYTWAHVIDTATSNLAGVPQNSLDYAAERGNGDYDIRHRFTLSLVYDLPSLKAPLQMGKGWQVTSILNFQTGMPYTLYDSQDDISYTGEGADRWDFHGNASEIHWSASTPIPFFVDGTTNPACVAQAVDQGNLAYYGCFQQGSAVITPPATGTFGNMGRNIFRGPAFHNWDMSVTKLWKLSEHINLQMRGEFFNILNHTNFAGFATDLSDAVSGANDVGLATSTPDVYASNPVVGSGGSRHIQLGAKIIW
jgi:hypothetical protein